MYYVPKEFTSTFFVFYLYNDDLRASPKQQLDSCRISILK